ncbi:uncharacterized protein LDX57_011947 [Aspergillus melleus]|uniref:uncharacterized protein n=1 Tax=Aspergillus melleus TaxID=138277 RepID=UPI001E8D0F75|nr:uncharacterized protein LDX57_011947 [Aspergillus melleus]KAH8434301.1 hypothetical protein LDX57_011947 [Aspergillus melleus]
MQFTTLLNLALLATSGFAYSNNCQGSSVDVKLSDCKAALARIDKGKTYVDQAQFSVRNCYMIYATNGSGRHPIKGQYIWDTANSIINSCGKHKGSFGTNNNCDKCHVTVNYRA